MLHNLPDSLSTHHSDQISTLVNRIDYESLSLIGAREKKRKLNGTNIMISRYLRLLEIGVEPLALYSLRMRN